MYVCVYIYIHTHVLTVSLLTCREITQAYEHMPPPAPHPTPSPSPPNLGRGKPLPIFAGEGGRGRRGVGWMGRMFIRLCIFLKKIRNIEYLFVLLVLLLRATGALVPVASLPQVDRKALQYQLKRPPNKKSVDSVLRDPWTHGSSMVPLPSDKTSDLKIIQGDERNRWKLILYKQARKSF